MLPRIQPAASGFRVLRRGADTPRRSLHAHGAHFSGALARVADIVDPLLFFILDVLCTCSL